VFRSFFPEPRIFFPAAVLWLAIALLGWFTIGDGLRAVISIDRFTSPAICNPDQAAEIKAAQAASEEGSTGDGATLATPESGATATPNTTNLPDCLVEDANFLNGAKIWQYEYIILSAIIFCVFWYFYKRNEWYMWSVVGSAGILLVIYFNVQVDAFINDWSGTFFNMVQMALSQPGSVDPGEYYTQVILIFAVLLPNILVLVLLAFYTSHYVFRWRKAMNNYYMTYWQTIRTTEGAAQRVQEDTMRFASIVEDLGTSFFSSLITLAVFLPILWALSVNITHLPLLEQVPGSLVWVALLAAALGTVLLAGVGVKLPGLNFQNQLVEAAYRKELVYGEDDAARAEPLTARELFAKVQKNYFRLYFHYTYFNLARYGYLSVAGYIPLLALSPSILAGALTLGLYQQVQLAFGQVSTSFQFFARAWSTIVELLSVHKRLVHFERSIPAGAPPAHVEMTVGVV